jgi:hypothetical protein
LLHPSKDRRHIVEVVKDAAGSTIATVEEPITAIARNIVELSKFEAVIIAAILSIVLFNTYEYFEIGRKIENGIGVSWRSAMLIGFFCGLTYNRIVAAFAALLTGTA